MNSLSVVIVTKNRSSDLIHCLGSLFSGSILPEEIIIINNGSSDSTRDLVISLGKNIKINIKYVYCEISSYPHIRNHGLINAKGEWIAFIDDDCTAEIDWIKEIKKTTKKYTKVASVMGWCRTYYSSNIFSLTTLMFNNIWKERSLSGSNVIDFEVLDSKNIVYRKSFLKKHGIKYDETRAVYQNGAAEDCDIGIQIQEVGGKAICNKNMLVLHKDPQNWLEFIKKHIYAWKSYRSLYLKWDIESRKKLKLKPRSLVRYVSEFKKENKLSLEKSLQIYLLAKQVTFISRILLFVSRITNEK